MNSEVRGGEKASTRWLWFFQLASPPHAYRLLGLWRPWLFWPAIVLLAFIGIADAIFDFRNRAGTGKPPALTQ